MCQQLCHAGPTETGPLRRCFVVASDDFIALNLLA